MGRSEAHRQYAVAAVNRRGRTPRSHHRFDCAQSSWSRGRSSSHMWGRTPRRRRWRRNCCIHVVPSRAGIVPRPCFMRRSGRQSPGPLVRFWPESYCWPALSIGSGGRCESRSPKLRASSCEPRAATGSSGFESRGLTGCSCHADCGHEGFLEAECLAKGTPTDGFRLQRDRRIPAIRVFRTPSSTPRSSCVDRDQHR